MSWNGLFIYTLHQELFWAPGTHGEQGGIKMNKKWLRDMLQVTGAMNLICPNMAFQQGTLRYTDLDYPKNITLNPNP